MSKQKKGDNDPATKPEVGTKTSTESSGEETSVSGAPTAGGTAAGPSLIPTGHGGALLSGGKPGNKGNTRQREGLARSRSLGQLEGIIDDLAVFLETARESDGDRVRCKNCGAFIEGISRLNLTDMLAVYREFKTVLPSQVEHEGSQEIRVILEAGRQVPFDD